jgi:hypothetical protein
VARDSSGNFAAGTITAALTGNASTATTLQTARNINGVSFNGSADITVADSTKLPLTGGTLTGSLAGTSAAFTGTVTWGTGNSSNGNPRSLAIGYSGGNYGQTGYGIAFTGTSGVHNYAINDIVSLWEAYDGLVVRAAGGGTVGTAITWTTVLDARRSNSALTFKGNTVLDSNNYNSYSPTLTGTGASGTWAINITGNAATATSATSATSASSATNASVLVYQDLRTIAPSSHTTGRLTFGFTAFNNNNSSPWADFIHLRSYTDGSGGGDNLVSFKRNGIGMRIWQQTWNSSTAYSSYVDVLDSSNYTSYTSFAGDVSATGQGRFTGWYTGNAATGLAAEIGISAGEGYIFTYNRTTSSYGTLNIAASSANLKFSGGTINATAGALQQGGNQVVHAGNYTSYPTTFANLNGGGVGYREDYSLGFRPSGAGSYAGFRFASPGNDANAGYFLIRGGADNDVYTENGLTIVADLGWLTLAQRTTAGKGVRIMTGTTSTERITVLAAGQVGIGTTSPVFDLSVSGVIQALGAGTDSVASGPGSIYLGNGSAGTMLRHTASRHFAIDTYSSSNVWTERVRVERDGNVGIGTASPGGRLQVSAETSTQQMLLVRNFATGSTGSFTGNYVAEIRSAYTTGATGGALLVHTQEASDSRPTMAVSDSNGVFATFVNGKVGIGTTSPNALLVAKASGNYGTIACDNSTTTGGGAFAVRKQGSAIGYLLNKGSWFGDTTNDLCVAAETGYNVRIYTNGSASEKFIFTTTGRFGISTTAPDYTLDVNGTFAFRSTGYAYNSTLYAYNSSTGKYLGFTTDSSGGNISMSDATLLRLQVNGGNVSIGGQLNVAGSKFYTVSNNSGESMELYVDAGAGANAWRHIVGGTGTGYGVGVGGYGFYYDGNSDYNVIFRSNGNTTFPGSIGIGNTSPSYKLHVTGDIYATSNITAYSDARAKENIITIEDALNKVINLRGVYYNKINESEKNIGVIAQEVLKVVPELVSYAKDIDEYSVKYQNITALLIEAIKELKKQLDEVKSHKH